MTVDTYTYCQSSDIQVLVGDIVPNRVFSGNSSPSIFDVDKTCDIVAALIHAKLASEGYPVLANTDMLSTYPLVQPLLKALNVYGACAQILQAVPGMAVDPSDASAPNSRANQNKKRFDDGIKSIEGQVLDQLGMPRIVSRTARVTVLQNLDPVTGFHNQPCFTRNMFDIPGSRSLERP